MSLLGRVLGIEAQPMISVAAAGAIAEEERARVTPDGSLENPGPNTLAFFGGRELGSGVSVTPDTASRSTAVWACIRLLSEGVASLPCHLYERTGPRSRDRATTHPIYGLLHDLPHPELTSFDFFEVMETWLETRGNAYAYIERSGGGRILALWPLRPDWMRVDRHPETKALRYTWSPPNGAPFVATRSEILHVHGPSRDGIVGLAPIEICAEAIGVSLAAEGFGARFFGNDAHAGVVLKHPGKLSKEAADRLKLSWDAAHGGFSRAHKTAVLEEGMSTESRTIPPEHAQFIETRRFQVAEIGRIWNVPLHMIQELERATFSNIEHQAIGYVVHSLRPRLVRWEKAIFRDLLTPAERRTYYAEFLVDALLRGEQKTRFESYAIGRQWGWLSADDVREKENLNPLPEGKGEEYLNPANMIPAGMIPRAFLEPPAPPMAPDPPPDDEEDDEDRAVRSAEALLPVIADAAGRVLRREGVDLVRAFEKAKERNDPAGLAERLEEFLRDHRGFVEQSFRAACLAAGELDPEAAAAGEAGAAGIAVAWIEALRASLEAPVAAMDVGAVRAAYAEATTPGWLRTWFEARKQQEAA